MMKLANLLQMLTILGAPAVHGLGLKNMFSVGKLALQFLADGAPTKVDSAFLRWPDLANYTDEALCNQPGKGRCADYLVSSAEYDQNLAAFDALPESERTPIDVWYDLDAGSSSTPGIDLDLCCIKLLGTGCKVTPDHRIRTQFKADIGAGLRSVQDEPLHSDELRRIFDVYDADKNGILTTEDYMAHGNMLQSSSDSKIYLFGIQNVLNTITTNQNGMNFDGFVQYWFGIEPSTLREEEMVSSLRGS